MGSFLRHPLVTVVAIATIAIGFYYFASLYQICFRQTVDQAEKKLVKRIAEGRKAGLFDVPADQQNKYATRKCAKLSW